MKWENEEDVLLKELINSGKKYKEISEIMNRSEKSIINRAFRIGLKIVSTKKCICLECGKEFEGYISDNRKFCNKSCSVSYNNRGKKKSVKTKRRIKKAVDHWNVKNPKQKKVKLKKSRFCKSCDNVVTEKYCSICVDCKTSYYKFYRPACRFKFSLSNYPCEFNFDLIRKHGWYQPVNRGNNLGGVSRDHVFSVKKGFEEGVDPKVISHPANCALLLHLDNNLKNSSCNISLDELKEKIKKWDEKYG